MTIMDIMNLIQSPASVLSLVVSLWCVYLIKKTHHELKQEIRAVETKLDAKIDKVETSLDAKINKVEISLNAKIDKVEASLDAKINKVEASLDALRDEFNGKFEQVGARFDALRANDLRHLEMHDKLIDATMVKEGRMSKQTYIALWGEEVFDVDLVREGKKIS